MAMTTSTASSESSPRSPVKAAAGVTCTRRATRGRERGESQLILLIPPDSPISIALTTRLKGGTDLGRVDLLEGLENVLDASLDGVGGERGGGVETLLLEEGERGRGDNGTTGEGSGSRTEGEAEHGCQK
jgi:hypothetical protein